MMMKSLANPNFPTMAALFHSTPFLSFKKRISWPQKYRHRGPPRLTFKLVWSPISSGLFFEKLNDANQTAWCGDERSQDNKKQHENKSSKSYSERSHDYSRQYENKSSKSSNNIRSSPDMTRERLALGLSANGPLKLEDVKTAYRSCAQKWHPDHNRGFTKTFAEEKFKTCNAAYQSLCNKLSSSS